MTAAVRIKRNGGFKTYQVEYTPDTTIAKILDEINETEEDPIAWDCSCRQKMCGNCAMLINRRPALACITFLKDLGNVITLEPLSKFPLIKDLKVDRSRMIELRKILNVYPEEGADADWQEHDRQYLAASCLSCGCCLEVCPNYNGRDLFGGAALSNSMFKEISQESNPEKRRERTRVYKKTQFRDCTKSLSCVTVCPMSLPMASTFSRLNACAFGQMKRKP
ncbi:MAG: 2Fe-2S iron-sulfur cluster-binding protein [Lachnospiraceae bacterium]|jgi:succinate dehydrogenase / fumarate reductase iron-sulfur subunit|nr:2Fe-2S iron-sulfur cluster-binding protein [Lachnospiraceae bacterium]